MNKRVLSMLTAGVLAVSPVLQAVPALAASHSGSGYILLNVPYSEFYGSNGITVDTVSQATPKVNNMSLMGGGDHTWGGAYGENESNQILGVTLPVYMEDLSVLDDALEIKSTDTREVSYSVKGQSKTDVLTGRQALLVSGDYAYYVIGDDEEKPADIDNLGYAISEDGRTISEYKWWAYKEANVDATLLAGADSNHTDYIIEGDALVHDGAEDNLDLLGQVKNGVVYGASVFTTDGETYPLTAIYQIWRNMEYGFNATDFDGALVGKTIQGITIYTATGKSYRYKFKDDGLVVPALLEDVAAEAADASTINLTGLPEDIENAVAATIYYQEGSGRNAVRTEIAADVRIVDGVITLPDDVTLEEGRTYYVKVTSDNYASALTNAFTYSAEDPDTPVTPEDPDQPVTPEDPDAPVTPDDKEDDADEETTVVVKEENQHKHTHNYEWVTTKTATATTDGLMKYRCKKCGKVEYEVPTSAYYVFNKETQEAVRNAAAGATVTVETPIFISFHEMVQEALTERSDVTLVVDYKNGGKSYEMTIPAGSGAVLEQLYGDDQFAGFLYLGGAFATVEK